MPNELGIYHRLPHLLRVLAASAKGYSLRRWRYGRETEQLVEEALERDTWNTKRWKDWQEERLAYVLHRAATRVPYYHKYWRERRRQGDRKSWEVLENWPILRKEIVRENPRAFVAEDCDTNRMFCDHTSGTTGTPLAVYIKRKSLRYWYALFEARIRRWNGVSIKERWAILGGQLVVPFHQAKPPFWVFNAGLNQLYMSTHHLWPKSAEAYIKALKRFRPTHMIVYPSSANVLATALLEQELEPPQLKVIFSNAELLLDSHRDTISHAFQCSVKNTYGMGELVAAASECEKGEMHIWPEVGALEVLDDYEDVCLANENVGRIVTTGILNEDMPLVRYEVGDRGQLSALQCSCGRSLPLLDRIEGRLNDLITTSDGRRIFWVNPIFYGLPIREAQIIQENLEYVRVRFVPAPDYHDQDGKALTKRLRDRVGDMEITLEKVAHIPRSSSGKLRAVVSKVKRENHN